MRTCGLTRRGHRRISWGDWSILNLLPVYTFIKTPRIVHLWTMHLTLSKFYLSKNIILTKNIGGVELHDINNHFSQWDILISHEQFGFLKLTVFCSEKECICLLICWGCHNKTPQTGLNNRNLLSHSSGGWKSEIRAPAWLASGESALAGL